MPSLHSHTRDPLCSKMNETDKLKHLIHIVRLLIEVRLSWACSSPLNAVLMIHVDPHLTQVGDDGQAQSYFHRASALIHNCDDAGTKLAYQLCNVRPLRSLLPNDRSDTLGSSASRRLDCSISPANLTRLPFDTLSSAGTGSSLRRTGFRPC